MRARIIKIGNSQGIRIPKPLLEQLKIKEDVDIEVEKNQIIVRPVSNPRIGWDNAFRKMAWRTQGDQLLHKQAQEL